MDCRCCKGWLLGLILLGKPIITQLINKLLMFYGTRRCIVLSQCNPVHTLLPIYFNIRLLLSSKVHLDLPTCFSFRVFLTHILFAFLTSPMRTTWSARLPSFIWWRVQLTFPHFILNLHQPAAYSLISPHILLNIILSHTLILRLFLQARVHISHPYKMTSIIIVP
jgi:hypothetical protein